MDSAITTKGQATIPKAIREHLGLKPGDRLKFFLHPDGSLAILPKLPASSLRGVLRYSGPRVSLEEMEAGIAKAATSRYQRFQRQK